MTQPDPSLPPPLPLEQPMPGAAASFVRRAPASSPVIHYEDHRARRPNPWRRVMGSGWFWPISASAYVAIGYVLISLFAFALGGLLGSPFLGGVQAVIALLVLTSAAFLMQGLRRNRHRVVLNYLEQAVRLNLPLPAMLFAAEQSESGGLRRRLSRLRLRLELGIPVARALDDAVPGMPTRTLRLVGAGERAGRLGNALRRLVTTDRPMPLRDPSTTIFRCWYPLILWVGVIGAASLLSIFVIPKYLRIMRDFGLPVPAPTRWMAEWGDKGLPIAAVLTVPILLIYVGRMTAMIFAPRLPRPAVLDLLIDPLLWRLPLARGVVRSRGLADVCNVLADSLEAGHSPAHALAEERALKLNVILRQRVRRWAERTEAGVPLADAARAAGMPGLLVGMLATAQTGDNTPGALRFLARYYESRFSRARELLNGAVTPVLAVAFGAIVLFVALAVFMPLVALADSLCARLSRGAM